MTTKSIPRHCQTSPGGERVKLPPAENHWSRVRAGSGAEDGRCAGISGIRGCLLGTMHWDSRQQGRKFPNPKPPGMAMRQMGPFSVQGKQSYVSPRRLRTSVSGTLMIMLNWGKEQSHWSHSVYWGGGVSQLRVKYVFRKQISGGWGQRGGAGGNSGEWWICSLSWLWWWFHGYTQTSKWIKLYVLNMCSL